MEWLGAAQELQYLADKYVKNRTPLTFAGYDRKKGAKDLRTNAQEEIERSVNEITALNNDKISLGKVYDGIARKKFEQAKDFVENEVDFNKLKTGTKAEKKEQRDILIEQIYTAMAASVTHTRQLDDPNVSYYDTRRSID